jgi:hypothetical protein
LAGQRKIPVSQVRMWGHGKGTGAQLSRGIARVIEKVGYEGAWDKAKQREAASRVS